MFNAGLIDDAIRAFEAVVQVDGDHAEAWRMLGQCHADHDEDQKAIVCLEKSAECDAYNLPTLLALGVCYVNELDQERALSNLKAWVEHNPEFMGLEVSKQPSELPFSQASTQHKQQVSTRATGDNKRRSISTATKQASELAS